MKNSNYKNETSPEKIEEELMKISSSIKLLLRMSVSQVFTLTTMH